MGQSAARTAKPLGHSTGSASVAPTGTVQRRSVRPPQATSARAAGTRIQSGTGTENWLSADPPAVAPRLSRSHDSKSRASIASETATSAAVTQRAIARERH